MKPTSYHPLAAKVASIPDDISDEETIFANLINMASHGVRRSGMQLGDDVLITGAGAVGAAVPDFGAVGRSQPGDCHRCL